MWRIDFRLGDTGKHLKGGKNENEERKMDGKRELMDGEKPLCVEEREEEQRCQSRIKRMKE